MIGDKNSNHNLTDRELVGLIHKFSGELANMVISRGMSELAHPLILSVLASKSILDRKDGYILDFKKRSGGRK